MTASLCLCGSPSAMRHQSSYCCAAQFTFPSPKEATDVDRRLRHALCPLWAGRVCIMASTQPFALYDCTLARCATGRSCSNLRELLDAIRTAPDAVLEHHMMRCALDDHFELFEFPNDLARWCWDGLGDHVLGEQLGLVDPYQQESTAALRAVLADMVEE